MAFLTQTARARDAQPMVLRVAGDWTLASTGPVDGPDKHYRSVLRLSDSLA